MREHVTLLTAISSILATITLSFVFHAPWGVPNFYSDIVSFWGRDWVSRANLPYVNSFFEYPPLGGFSIFLARLIGRDLVGYYSVFGLMTAVVASLVAWSTWSISRLAGVRLNSSFFLMPSLLLFGIYNFDLLHVLFIMLSIQLLLLKHNTFSAIASGLGILTKLTNVVLLPLFLLEIRSNKERLAYLGVSAATILAVNLPLAYTNFSTWGQTYTYLRGYGLENAWFLWIFWDPSKWEYAKFFGFGIAGILLLRAYTLKTDLLTKAFLCLSAYLLGTYIYTPQLNIILIPLAAVLLLEHPSFYVWEVANALIILTWFIVPNPLAVGSMPQLMATLRAAALVWVSLALLRKKGIPLRSLVPSFLLKPMTQFKDEFQGKEEGEVPTSRNSL